MSVTARLLDLPPASEPVPGWLDVYRTVRHFAWRPRWIDGRWCWFEWYFALERNATGHWSVVGTARTIASLLHRPH